VDRKQEFGMNLLIITVAVIVWLIAKLVGRSADRKSLTPEDRAKIQRLTGGK
jgi:hypothetical protein